MLVAAIHILGFIANSPDSITVRKFSLVTAKGESVLHTDFDRRRLRDNTVSKISLKFNAENEQFEFKFDRRYPIFAPGATIKMTGDVREYIQVKRGSIR